MSPKTSSKFCCAAHCMNNSKRNPDLSYFSLPEDVERRRKWLKSISRPDLLQRTQLKAKSYLVCSAHFEEASIKIIKLLKKDALPTLNLEREDESSGSDTEGTEQTEEQSVSNNKLNLNVETQTEAPQSPEAPQDSLPGHIGRTNKRKLNKQVAEGAEYPTRNKVYHIVYEEN